MGNINTQLQKLLQTEMSRKEFLTTIGWGVLSVVGVATLIQALGKQDRRPNVESFGYGGSVYGGRK